MVWRYPPHMAASSVVLMQAHPSLVPCSLLSMQVARLSANNFCIMHLTLTGLTHWLRRDSQSRATSLGSAVAQMKVYTALHAMGSKQAAAQLAKASLPGGAAQLGNQAGASCCGCCAASSCRSMPCISRHSPSSAATRPSSRLKAASASPPWGACHCCSSCPSC